MNVAVGLSARRIYDVQVCMGVMHSMWDDISEDDAEEYYPDVVNEYWIGMFTDKLVGMYRIHQLTSVSYQIHAFMMDRSQKDSGKVILQWVIDNLPDMLKLNADIPEIFPNVLHFCLNLGFQDEGYDRHCYSKNGRIWGMNRLGITRDEICQQL